MKKFIFLIPCLLGLSFRFCYHIDIQSGKCEKYTVLDSLKFVYALPDDYFFYPHGDSICSRIIAHGTDIIPCLVENITDTTPGMIRVSDTYNYVVGDIALLLIEWISCNEKDIPDIYLTELMITEFHKKDSASIVAPLFFDVIHYKTFVENSKEKNYQNRQAIYEKIKNILLKQ